MSKNSIYAIYKAAFNNYGKLYHPNWQPTVDRKLGDFGTMHNGIFTRLGNVLDLEININASVPKVTAHQTFTSGGGVSSSFTAKGKASGGSIGAAKASLKVNFTGGQGVNINAYGLQHIQILNLQAVANAIITLFNKRKWQQGWLLIVEIYQADKCLIAISGNDSEEAEIEFETTQKVPVADISISNAGLDLVLKSQSNIGFTLDNQSKGVTLGFGLSKVDVTMFTKSPKVQPFENKGSWGSDGPTSMWLEGGYYKNNMAPYIEDAGEIIEKSEIRFLRVPNSW